MSHILDDFPDPHASALLARIAKLEATREQHDRLCEALVAMSEEAHTVDIGAGSTRFVNAWGYAMGIARHTQGFAQSKHKRVPATQQTDDP